MSYGYEKCRDILNINWQLSENMWCYERKSEGGDTLSKFYNMMGILFDWMHFNHECQENEFFSTSHKKCSTKEIKPDFDKRCV